MKKILILFGGASFEHEVSCSSAKTVLENIDYKKYDVTAAGITKDNIWYLFEDTPEILTKGWTKGKITKIENIIEFLKSFDKVFPIMHGAPVENGAIEGLFDLFNIKYVGSNLASSIVGYDKELTKIICAKNHIPQVPHVIINENKALEESPIEFPVIVKPTACGSSIGINIANNLPELNKYLKEAFEYDHKVIIEKYIPSREFECGVLERENLRAAPVGEIKASNTFYDYEAKYEKESEILIPAPIPESLTETIQDLSLKIFKILNLKDLSRIDFLYDEKNDKLYFNEVNTMPGFTSTSMFPMLYKETGISITELITILIENEN